MGRNGRSLPLFSRLLPREFRERIFAPAWADVLLEEQQSGAYRGHVVLARVVLAMECLRLGLPQLVWHRGRLTRLARGVAVALVAVAVLMILLLRATYVASAMNP